MVQSQVSLSPEQQNVLDCVLKGESMFFTGSAGTGKSVLLRHIIAALKRTHASRPDAVAITASTGMAACAIGGTTIHSFAGIGLGAESKEALLNKVKKNRKASGRWMRTKILIIDESQCFFSPLTSSFCHQIYIFFFADLLSVSMVEGDLFDKLAYIATKMKKATKPFGGIQVGHSDQKQPILRFLHD
jgi:ATP-dependent DNA helicase PIF1